MHVLSNEETSVVKGGNPAVIFVAGAIVGGLIYDAAKEAYSQLSNTSRSTSTGGNMQRGQ